MFRIGEFSKLAMVSVRMLRHYDEIGLLIPDKVDEETGYRYYSAAQLGDIGRIQLLRQMGAGLNDIARMLRQFSQPQELEHFLQSQLLQLNKKQQQLESQRSLVQSAIDRLRKEQTMNQFHVEKKVFPSMQVASLRKVIPSYNHEGELWQEMYGTFAQMGGNVKMAANPYAMAVFYDEGFKEQDVDVEIRSAVAEPFADCGNVCCKTIPQITAATVTFSGSYDQVSQVYAEIAGWVEQNGCQMEGPMFNIYHVSPGMDPDPAHWVTEVCVPLKG